MTATTTKTFGLLISHELRHGTDYVEARVISREQGRDYPVGVCSVDRSDFDLPKHLHGCALDGLGMCGFVSDSCARKPEDISFIGYDVEFRDVHSVDASKAARMLKSLKRAKKVIEAAHAYEPGDKFAAFAKAFKLEFVVEKIASSKRFGGSYSDNDWNWMTVTEGRNRFRTLIEDSVREVRERHFPNAA